MDDLSRGKIRNKALSSQIKDYSGMRYGKITPMDLDGVIEFGNKLYILLEYKGSGAPLAFGQRLCLERIVSAIHLPNRIAVCLVADHNQQLSDEVDCANAIVRQYFYKCKWRTPRQAQLTVKQAVDTFRSLSGF